MTAAAEYGRQKYKDFKAVSPNPPGVLSFPWEAEVPSALPPPRRDQTLDLPVGHLELRIGSTGGNAHAPAVDL